MKEEPNELFFVQVKDPNEVRRNILETLREIVEVLKKFEKFKSIRHEKLEKINHLRVLVRQANKMLGDLRMKLPQTNLRAVVVRETPKPSKKHRKKAKNAKAAEEKTEKAPKKEMTELDKLESELSAIEGKLKSLT